MATLPNPNPRPVPSPEPDPNPVRSRRFAIFDALRHPKEPPMRFITRVALTVAVCVTPALAADGFYIVKEEGSSVCKVVDVKPTDGKTVLVDSVIYTTELEARDAITKTEACQS